MYLLLGQLVRFTSQTSDLLGQLSELADIVTNGFRESTGNEWLFASAILV